jgi:RimJ/RimL family protein N-acetyltransferase
MLDCVESPSELYGDFRRIRSPLEGRLVRLRPLEREDLERLQPLFNDPDVMAGITIPFPIPLAAELEWLERIRTSDSELILGIETLEGELVGNSGLRGLGIRNRTADLGIFVGKPYWNRGYGTDAVRTLCRFGFRHLNLQRIELHVYETNPRGIRAYEKVGFKLEGTLRRNHFVEGRYVDEHVMGLLAEELIEEEA